MPGFNLTPCNMASHTGENAVWQRV
jgi:hypothetical protein